MPFREFVGYRKSELDELTSVLKERPDDPIGWLIFKILQIVTFVLGETDDDDEIKSHKVYSSYSNSYLLTPEKLKWHINITAKIDNENISTIIQQILECFFLPFLVRIDFFAIAESATK